MSQKILGATLGMAGVLLWFMPLAVSAQTVQQFCDTLASNAQNMYRDVNSQEYANGMVTHDELATRYAGARSQVSFDLIFMQRDILEQIIVKRGEVPDGLGKIKS